MSREFFNEPREQSIIKSVLVEKYLGAWTRIMNRRANSNKLGYIDLFCGPGVYEDGYESTPIKVVKYILRDNELKNKMLFLFNDADPKYIRTLEDELLKVEGIDSLKHKPVVQCTEVNHELSAEIMKLKMIPSLVFIDPFGYKGVTRDLIHGFTKDWGCDCFLFFNFNRINPAVSNPLVADHMKALFGESRFNDLTAAIASDPSSSREDLILNYFSLAMKDIGNKYILPFRFQCCDKESTSHYLIFLTKNRTAYDIVKEIMAKQSRPEDSDFGTFEFIPSQKNDQLNFLSKFSGSLTHLKSDLLNTYTGKRLTVKTIFDDHSYEKNYILKNYKDALLELEAEKKIIANPSERRIIKGKKTMADNVVITFP